MDGTVTFDVTEGQEVREYRAATASIACEECGALWSEEERRSALRALDQASDHGWRQTRAFVCCDVKQAPELWNEFGRALCRHCEQPAPFDGHAGFHASKLYSIRHRLRTLVSEFLNAKGDPEMMRKFTNTALAELWELQGGEELDVSGFMARAEPYGPNDLLKMLR